MISEALQNRGIGAPTRTVAPSTFPVTPQEAMDELDIIDDPDAATRILNKLIQAVDMVERDARRCLMPQTWQMVLDGFPCGEIEIRKVPVAAVSFVKYYTGGVLTTWSSSNYQTDLVSEPARITPVPGVYWPATDCERMNAVQIEWTAGYASAALVPPAAKMAVLMAVKHLYYGCEVGSNYWSAISRLQPFGFIQ